ncbi:MAG: attachment protein [Alphaproteobacteria bacterium]|nr:MAG: attachment protein [Alphaproteobacteria bacterium]
MKLPHNAHVAVIDGETCTLYRNIGKLFEPKLAEEERPQLDPTNFSAGVRDGDQIGRLLGRTDLKELAHGAAAAEWLNAKAVAGLLDELLIVADPKTLGEMRLHYHGELNKRIIGEIAKTLTGMTVKRIETIIAKA